MGNNRILWVDDEIDLLRPHILFLQEKGYEVTPINNGQDAIEYFRTNDFNIVFLDENMPGLSGLDTLNYLKDINAAIPVVMITKNEDEGIMNDAIGRKIADYLIKPVNPHQILMSLKKNLHRDDIVSSAALEGYRADFNAIALLIEAANDHKAWTEIHKKLVAWDIELTATNSPLLDLLDNQKQDANRAYSKFIKQNYETWFLEKDKAPLMSHNLISKKILPMLEHDKSVFMIVIDNFRLDQWLIIRELLANDFTFEEDTYYSILPTATHYARNAIFAGLMPADISKMYPQYWVEESYEESKNQNESELIGTLMERYRKNYSYSYHKLSSSVAGNKYLQQIPSLADKKLNVLVMNFIDMLSHSRTESNVIRELAADEAAYRSLTQSWFKHSSALEIFKKIAELGCKLVLTTDHGTIRVRKPIKVQGDKDINTNLRYKIGNNLEYDRKKVYDIRKPENIGLPTPQIATKYIFASGDDFFAYPNNFNYYTSYFTDTFQHGGISLEEMIVPFVTMSPK